MIGADTVVARIPEALAEVDVNDELLSAGRTARLLSGKRGSPLPPPREVAKRSHDAALRRGASRHPPPRSWLRVSLLLRSRGPCSTCCSGNDLSPESRVFGVGVSTTVARACPTPMGGLPDPAQTANYVAVVDGRRRGAQRARSWRHPRWGGLIAQEAGPLPEARARRRGSAPDLRRGPPLQCRLWGSSCRGRARRISCAHALFLAATPILVIDDRFPGHVLAPRSK